ncbi:MAG: hypothetical protein ACE5FN_02905 [Leptospirillia bacterium]
MTPKRFIPALLATLLTTVLLTACGGGGGGGGDTGGGGHQSPYTPDGSVPASTANLLTLVYDTSTSDADRAVFYLELTNVENGFNPAADATAVAADLTYEPLMLTFVSFAPAPGISGIAIAAPTPGSTNRLVLAITGPVAGRLGTLTFNKAGLAGNTDMTFDAVSFVGPEGSVLAARRLTGQGGRLEI